MEYISKSITNGALVATINRPDKLNSLNAVVIDELKLLIDELYQNSEIKGMIITGSGDKAFAAGADISEFIELSQFEAEAMSAKGHKLFNRIENSSKPIIAAVNGFALGGGCELAMACHIRIASMEAKFGQPEVNLGLIPGYGGTQRLPQLIGKGRALYFLLTGDMIDANEALEYGLVNEIVEQDKLLEVAQSVIEKIGEKGPIAVAKTILAVNAVFDESKNGFRQEIISFGECFGTQDSKEGIAAFMEKRKPEFNGW